MVLRFFIVQLTSSCKVIFRGIIIFLLINVFFLPRPVLAIPSIPNPMLLGYQAFLSGFDPTLLDQAGPIPVPNVVEMTVSSASNLKAKEAVRELTQKGVLVARHLGYASSYEQWQNAIRDNLGGYLPGGFKAVAIDEVRLGGVGSEVDTGDVNNRYGRIVRLRQDFPELAIFVWVYRVSETPSLPVLDILNQYADRIMLEIYQIDNFTDNNTLNQKLGAFKTVVQKIKDACQGQLCDGILNKTVVGLATADTENWCYDCNPKVDFPKFLDAEIYTIKTDPLLSQLPGMAFYSYARTRPETIIWINQLARHYYFEGKTSRFSDENYFLNAIINPIFEEDIGWSFQKGAGGGDISYKTNDEVGIPFPLHPNQSLPGRLNINNTRLPKGNRLLWMKRGDTPNQVSQTITVSPSRFYHLDIYAKYQTYPYDKEANAQVKTVDEQGNDLVTFQDKRIVHNDYLNHPNPSDPNYPNLKLAHDKNYLWTRFRTEFKTPSNVSQIKIILTDAPAATNEITLWDFVELEELKLASLTGGAGSYGNPVDVLEKQNGGFERDSFFWQEVQQGGNSLHGTIDNTTVKEGSKSLLAKTNQGSDIWTQNLFLQPPLTYRLSGWIYVRSGQQAAIFLRLKKQDNTIEEIVLSADTSKLNQWQFLGKTIPFGWQYQNQVTLGIRVRGTPSAANFDGLTLDTFRFPTFTPSTWIEAEAGNVLSPFTVTANYISQATASYDNPLAGGKAIYTFKIPRADNYSLKAQVNAPNDGANSFFVNFDQEPTSPTMIWDINPITTNFQERTLSWRGNGTYDNPQYNPKVFNLTASTHTLIISGREPNTQLDKIMLTPITPTPTPTPRPTATPTPRPTRIPTPSLTGTPTSTRTPTPTRTPTVTPGGGPTNTPIPTPLLSNTPTPTLLITNTPTPTSIHANCPKKTQGDADCNGVIDETDYQIWRCFFVSGGHCLGPFGNYYPDFNRDGKINLIDLEIWRRNRYPQ